MKTTFTTLFVVLSSTFSYSQTGKYQQEIHIMSMKERYDYDYKLKNYEFIDGDSSILDLINIDLYEPQRLLEENIEIYISEINQTLILYPMNNPRKGF